jgi:hypothetical protein
MNPCRRWPRTPWRQAYRWPHSVVDRGSSRVRIGPALAAALVVLSGCFGPELSGAEVVTVEPAGFRLPLPQGWYAETTNDVAGQLRVAAFISNQPLGIDCLGSGTERHCTQPATLAEGGLLIWWLATFCAGVDCRPPTGDALLVGGREASRISGAPVCNDLEITSSETYIVAVSPQRLDAIMVCQRNAPASDRDELADMLEHVDWRTP